MAEIRKPNFERALSRRQFIKGVGTGLSLWAEKELISDGWRRLTAVDTQFVPQIKKLSASNNPIDIQRANELIKISESQANIGYLEGFGGTALALSSVIYLFRKLRD